MPQPVDYMARTRAYYAAQGFTRAYSYARHDDAPFAPLPKPVEECTLGLVTTASATPRADLEPRQLVSIPGQPAPRRLFTDDLSWDKQATHTDDVGSFCPVEVLGELAIDGHLGAVGPRIHCLPTEYSQRTTREHDAPALLERLRDDRVDIALLVPL